MTDAAPRALGDSPVELHADPEHGGIRAAVFVSLFVALLIAYPIALGLFRVLAPQSLQDYAVFLSCLGSFPLALLMVYGLEKLLRRFWHSGLSLLLDERGLSVRDSRAAASIAPEAEAPAIEWSKPLTLTNWYFRLSGYPRGGRERRVDSDWLCLANQLQQDDARLVVFCFMPPQQAEALINDKGAAFHLINPGRLYDVSARTRVGPPTRPTIPNELLHSKDGRIWLAERRRWEHGVELLPDDFMTYLAYARRAERRADPDSAEPTGGAA